MLSNFFNIIKYLIILNIINLIDGSKDNIQKPNDNSDIVLPNSVTLQYFVEIIFNKLFTFLREHIYM